MAQIIDVTTAKEFLRITHNAQDNVLSILVAAASEWLEHETGMLFCGSSHQTVTEDADGGGHNLWMGHAPIRSVVSITDQNTSTAETVADCRVAANRISRVDDDRWPSGSMRYRVIYTTGYKTSEIPADLKLLALQVVSRAFTQRGGLGSTSAAGYTENFEALLTSAEMVRLRQYRQGGMLG